MHSVEIRKPVFQSPDTVGRVRSDQEARTKVVATVGPASGSPEMLFRLAQAGVSVFRLNFSHGSHESHAETVLNVREVSRELAKPIGLLADLCGPKIRLGKVPEGMVVVGPGEEVVLSSEAPENEAGRFHVQLANFHNVVKPGNMVLIDDGLVHLQVQDLRGTDVIACVKNHNPVELKSRKGINLPGANLPIPAMTEKDHLDLRFALSQGVDMVALSFVRSPRDVVMCREAMRHAGREVPLLSKIEKSEAIQELEGILQLSDGAMVARGDLGVEIPVHLVPHYQRRIIEGCNRLSKPVITATQMLNSMIDNPVPTRAEVTDIYNAILDGTDAVMLSGETAAGKYPLECVQTMRAVSLQAEADMGWSRTRGDVAGPQNSSVSDAVAEAAVRIARDISADVIICPTFSGTTAKRVAMYRPPCRVVAPSDERDTVTQLTLTWGVQPRYMEHLWGAEAEGSEGDAIIAAAVRSAKQNGLVEPGMLAVVLAGLPLHEPGRTNFLRVTRIG